MDPLCPAYVDELLERVQNMYGTRNKHNIVQIKYRTIKYGINSFTHEFVKLWNELKQDFKVLSSIEDFKSVIASFFNGRTDFLTTLQIKFYSILRIW